LLFLLIVTNYIFVSIGTPIHVGIILLWKKQVSVRAIKGGRLSMEDEYFVGDGGRFVAVFDGHGGAGVSQYLRKHLYDAVKVHLQKCHWEESELEDHTKTQASALPRQPPPKTTIPPQKSTDKIPSVFSHAAALKAAFAQIDKDVLANESLSYQGSTAVAVVVHEGEDGHRTLLSANVGDSRAILSRRGRAVDLTRDHKPNDDKEKARILAMGETIEWDQYSKVHRVRNLSLSRAIGDRYAKPVVTGEAEIKHYPVVDDGDEFILLASDGLWDVMTSDEVVSFVHQRIKQELERDDLAIEELKNYKLVLRRNMAKFVAREAIRRGSGDNVCVIMVWLNDLHRKY
jgi:protein phosphatase